MALSFIKVAQYLNKLYFPYAAILGNVGLIVDFLKFDFKVQIFFTLKIKNLDLVLLSFFGSVVLKNFLPCVSF